ncbi:molybdopterin-binding protein [Streptomyces sp. LBL]|nr:molybdopterin-binding protein [Streptomyces sp. LBL]
MGHSKSEVRHITPLTVGSPVTALIKSTEVSLALV